MGESIRKIQLELTSEHCCQFLGIVSSMPSFTIAWELNNTLEIDFSRKMDMEGKGLVQRELCVYHSFVKDYESDIFLYKIKSSKLKKMAGLEGIDYLLVEQNFDLQFSLNYPKIISLRKFEFVFQINKNGIKNDTLKHLNLL